LKEWVGRGKLRLSSTGSYILLRRTSCLLIGLVVVDEGRFLWEQFAKLDEMTMENVLRVQQSAELASLISLQAVEFSALDAAGTLGCHWSGPKVISTSKVVPSHDYLSEESSGSTPGVLRLRGDLSCLLFIEDPLDDLGEP
jgi:hypothetical protein